MRLASGGVSQSQWDDVMFQLGRWLARHLDDPRLVLWIAGRGAELHERWTWLIEHELDRLTELANASEHGSDRHLLLSLYRRQVADTSEWPASAGAASRLLFYVVIPPFVWIAAALVQNVASNVLGLR